jgi:pectate lyase
MGYVRYATASLALTFVFSAGCVESPSEDVANASDALRNRRCGDGVCRGSEDCSSCPSDCGACPAPPPPSADVGADPTTSCSDGSCPVKAFPTAEGFGAQALGGRGGRVIEVTNLNDSGPGSLRACATATGSRTCVFRVSGTIELQSSIIVTEPNSYLTIAGQTAPGGGIQLKNWYVGIEYGAHDVVVRHLRVRQGTDASPVDINNDCGGLIVYDPTGWVRDVIVDHCSIAWSCDDSLNVWNHVTNTTLQWNLVGEGLTNADYPGANSKGFIVQGEYISAHHNLFVHMASRDPASANLATFDFVNNVVYNFASCHGNADFNHPDYPDFSVRVNFVGNKYVAGPETALMCVLGMLSGYDTRLYVSDNWTPFCPGGECGPSEWNLGFVDGDLFKASGWSETTPASEGKFRAYAPFTAPAVTRTSIANVEDVVAAGAGAIRPARDSLDARLVSELRTRTGHLGREGAPYPVLVSATAPADSDHDGMPDAWELTRGLSPDDASDGPRASANGYTNLENYLNELAGDPVP